MGLLTIVLEVSMESYFHHHCYFDATIFRHATIILMQKATAMAGQVNQSCVVCCYGWPELSLTRKAQINHNRIQCAVNTLAGVHTVSPS